MNNIQDIATSDTTTHKILAAISIQRKISETIDDFSKTGIISFEQKAFIEKCEIARKEIEISVKKIKLLPAIDKDSPEFIEQSEIAYDSYSKVLSPKEKRIIEEFERDHKIISKSRKMLRIFKKIKIGIARKTFLITGAPGTGKEGIANAIHRLSKQKSELISINAAASSSTLEDELFGHKKGAFTDAIEDRTGGIELANNGTLFLDEIGDVSQQIQKSLLRVLETNKVKKIGEEIEKSVKFKLVTATNRDLSQRVATGEMRDDFYSRINGMKIHLPPLSERKGDIPLLSNHFFHKQFVEYQENDDHLKHSFKITSGDFKPLENRDWVLGNIRDLKNHIEDLAATYFGWLREDYEIDRNLFHKLVEDPEFDIEESESISAIINDQEKECLGSMIKNDFKIVAVAENMSLGRDKVQSVINNALLKFGSKVEYSVESMVQLIVDKLQLEDPEQRFKLLNEIDLRFTKILSHNQVSPKIYSKELIDLVLELENIRKI